jgi:hypothetical protein
MLLFLDPNCDIGFKQLISNFNQFYFNDIKISNSYLTPPIYIYFLFSLNFDLNLNINSIILLIYLNLINV